MEKQVQGKHQQECGLACEEQHQYVFILPLTSICMSYLVHNKIMITLPKRDILN